jgi:hypothetical protein
MTVRVEKLSRAMMRRSMRLLDMEYKPSEIADELAASKEQILRLVSAGAPARKDSKGHYWIHGETFVEWLNKAAPKNNREKRTFADNEAWCVRCKAQVIYTETRRKGRVSFGKCPHGHNVARYLSSNPTGKARSKK